MFDDKERLIVGLLQYLDDNEDRDNSDFSVTDEFYDMYLENKDKGIKDSFDYLEMAYESDDFDQILKYANKALKLNKYNLGASVLICEVNATSALDLQYRLEELRKGEEERLEKGGYFEKECIGRYFNIAETRAYIRLLVKIVGISIAQFKIKKAIDITSRILKLDKEDHTTIRELYIFLYVVLLDEKNALKVFNKKSYDGSNNTTMLLALSLLYYRLDNELECSKYAKMLFNINKDAKDFFNNFDDIMDKEARTAFDLDKFEFNSKIELVQCFIKYSFALENIDPYLDYMISLTKENKYSHIN